MGADFVPPQFQNPDFLRSAALGQQMGIQQAMAPGELQGQQQNLQAGSLKLEQLRSLLNQEQFYQDAARKSMMQDQQASQQPTGAPPSGIAQNDTQGLGAAPVSPGPSDNILGMSARTIGFQELAKGGDIMKTAEGIQAYQQKQKQFQAQGPLNLLESVSNSPNADLIVKNNPSLQQMWMQGAPKLGLDPFRDLTPENAKKVANFVYNGVAGLAGLPPKDFGFSGTLKPGEAAYKNGQMVAGSTDAVTPYQKQEMDLRQQEFKLAQQRFSFDQNQSKVPSGYQVNAKDPTQIEPIPGGPKDPNAATAGGLGGREGVMFQRVANAGNSAVESIKNITELPVTTSTGWFGTAQKGTTLLGSVKGVLTQKLNGQDIQDYQTMLAGVSRNLATLETAGLAPGGSLTHSMDALAIGQGDTQMTKLRKLAEMRQIVDTNLAPQLSNPKIPAPQKEMIQGILDKVDKAVPFTHSNITAFEQSTNPRATMLDFAKSSGVQAQADKAHPADVQALLDKYK